MRRFSLPTTVVSALAGVFVLLSLASPAQADTVRINGTNYTVTATEAAQMALDASKRQDEASAPSTTIQQVGNYAELGRTIGASLAASAKEMGVAVNDFATTPIGVLATWLIVYKLIGHDIVHFFVGGVWLLVALPSWFYVYRRVALIKEIRFETDERNRKIKFVKYYDTARDDVAGYHFGFLAIGVIITVAGILIIFT